MHYYTPTTYTRERIFKILCTFVTKKYFNYFVCVLVLVSFQYLDARRKQMQQATTLRLQKQ